MISSSSIQAEMDVKPYILAIIIVAIYTGMFVISKAAFNQGMNSFVFVFYRQAAASLFLLPIALVLERKNVQTLSLRLLVKLFFLALIGDYDAYTPLAYVRVFLFVRDYHDLSGLDLSTLGQNFSNASVTLTSATVASATSNSTPVITFCLALIFRMEVVKLRSSSGIAKVAGVALCLAGALAIAFYTGQSLRPINHHRVFGTHAANASKAPNHATWIIGTFLMVLSNVTWSLWMVWQAMLLKQYPNKMLITTVQCVLSMVQSFVVAAVAERDFAKWKLQFDVSLLAVAYTGFVVTGVAYYLQAWCVEIRGPVFLAVWNPLCFVLTIFCSSFFLGEIVHLGSIVGGLLLVCGLYSVLWGKSKETKIFQCSENIINVVQDGKEHEYPQAMELGKKEQDEATSASTV